MSNVFDIATRRPIDGDPREAPRPGECVICFVRRMVAARGCTGALPWVERWRLARARRATALVDRLRRRGAACDCAVVGGLWTISAALWVPDPLTGELTEPTEVPDCPGVRPNSTQACELWVDLHRLAL